MIAFSPLEGLLAHRYSLTHNLWNRSTGRGQRSVCVPNEKWRPIATDWAPRWCNQYWSEEKLPLMKMLHIKTVRKVWPFSGYSNILGSVGSLIYNIWHAEPLFLFIDSFFRKGHPTGWLTYQELKCSLYCRHQGADHRPLMQICWSWPEL